jgi:hypothetical protein
MRSADTPCLGYPLAVDEMEALVREAWRNARTMRNCPLVFGTEDFRVQLPNRAASR